MGRVDDQVSSHPKIYPMSDERWTDETSSHLLKRRETKANRENRFLILQACTTNCLAPLAKVNNDRFGIVEDLIALSCMGHQAYMQGRTEDFKWEANYFFLSY